MVNDDEEDKDIKNKKKSFLKKHLHDQVAKRATEPEIMSVRPKGIET